MKSNKKNINWINVVKAICIIFVYYAHCTAYYRVSIGRILTYVFPFYVNAFFFVSGYLLFRKQLSPPIIEEDYKEYQRKKGGDEIF